MLERERAPRPLPHPPYRTPCRGRAKETRPEAPPRMDHARSLRLSVRALAAEELVEAFEALAAPATTERIVGGYKVKAKRRVTSYEEHQKRKATVAEVIAKSLLKQKKGNS